MNEYLERALLQHYRRRQRLYLAFLGVAMLAVGAVAAWLRLAQPEDGLWSKPVAAVGFPCAVAVVIMALFLTIGDRRVLLRALRQGIEVRAVRRGTLTYAVTLGGSAIHEEPVPRLIVELGDGRLLQVLRFGRGKVAVDELARIEELLRKQIRLAAKPAATRAA